MLTFQEANQKRIAIKMQLINYAWYENSTVFSCKNGYCVQIFIKKMNNEIKNKMKEYNQKYIKIDYLETN